MDKSILVVEDESSIRKFVKINLERNGFKVLEAESGEEGIAIARKEKIDMVILDIMLPGIDGFQVCKVLREEFPNLGIIMLTAKSQDVDKIMGLEYGTDDYMTKPFNPTELVLRVKSLARRIESSDDIRESTILVSKPFEIDTYSRKFYKENCEIELTPTEYAIAKLFLQNPGRAFKRDEILNLVWGYDFVGDSKIVDVNIRRLRAKIENDSSNPSFIETVWGIGYRWKNAD
ncbi:response regulator transcription factor [Tissierella praeacuta]|uniref:DNA-binding response regulator, OmpR family, contains REC and winged-helix (WHTH) domain n=1 Tax=Tissierella praeacuta DSM 18095 TaxID=1123404 RepID=A0A1M4S560_9FIRM|nr:response regulator transcription factor [Tissierella praeacuta]MBU5257025.1 response regulator transcription factor [Tissierella praeacuta]TCU71595.1 DNA-binding response OmpR family regulator [Tissierella praeacuta]SHE27335.1 DNA-binding response regulator, OmpR family, contains REC and winged-helix (wHTH) domain [Tissierella praeacuta DSM 18095]SUP00866.1 Alkaline phosphatase synthesis transcriptional regulatory protein phoP [Tissierella praeacuta]